MYQLGVDTGGTFTDFVAVNKATGATVTFKLPSSPDDPASVVAAGFERLSRDHGIAATEIERFVFGTTVATNALLERKGARVALLTTEGARDVLEIQRMWRQRLFDLYLRKPEPLVARRDRYEVPERIAANGEVVRALTEEDAEKLADIATGDYEAIAVCLLFSFVAPEHEHRLRDAILRRAPDTHVSLSSEISPEFREYERTSTTVMNAYVMPKIDWLMSRLDTSTRAKGYQGPIGIMQSNGGIMSVETAQRVPVNTLLSGPAGGVVGAMQMARVAGLKNVVAMDMGGTSLDVSVVTDGEVELTPESYMGGLPIKVPQISVHTIGAGGGSIARIVQGVLKVGPESAGADPGPACYGLGGREPTSTDAAAAVGYIDPGFFAGGAVKIDIDKGREVIAEHLQDALGMNVAEAAFSIIEVQVANMVNGIRSVTVEKGRDPREFALLSFGGAGALYAGLVAEALGMRQILVPVNAGVMSAHGMLLTDVKHTQSTTRLLQAESGIRDEVVHIFEALESALTKTMALEGVSAEHVFMERRCEARYRGQAYEVSVEMAEDLSIPDLVEAFHLAHAELYGHSAPEEAVELVNFRVTAIGEVAKPEIAELPGGEQHTRGPAPASVRQAYFGPRSDWQECLVYDRAVLPPGTRLTGPALVADSNATTVVYPGHELRVDRFGSLLITVPQQG